MTEFLNFKIGNQEGEFSRMDVRVIGERLYRLIVANSALPGTEGFETDAQIRKIAETFLIVAKDSPPDSTD